MLLIGENLVDSLGADDICGASYSSRFNSNLITIWNADARNEQGVEVSLRKTAECL